MAGKIIYQWSADLLESDAQLIVQQCNCVSSKGKGLSLSIATAFPHADFYSYRSKPSTPGTIEVRGGMGGTRWVCALYAQYHEGGPTARSAHGLVDNAVNRLKWFKECLEKLAKAKNMLSVAFPYNIGCGLAKGNWQKYEKAIVDFAKQLQNTKVYIISRDPNPKKTQIDLGTSKTSNGENKIKTDPQIVEIRTLEFCNNLAYLLNNNDELARVLKACGMASAAPITGEDIMDIDLPNNDYKPKRYIDPTPDNVIDMLKNYAQPEDIDEHGFRVLPPYKNPTLTSFIAIKNKAIEERESAQRSVGSVIKDLSDGFNNSRPLVDPSGHEGFGLWPKPEYNYQVSSNNASEESAITDVRDAIDAMEISGSESEDLSPDVLSIPMYASSEDSDLDQSNPKPVRTSRDFVPEPNTSNPSVYRTLTFPPEEYTWGNSTLLEYTTDYHPENGWENFFDYALNESGIISNVSAYLEEEALKTKIYPPLHQVYTFADLLSVDRIKVVIIGQDPYHTPGQAMGVAFAIAPGNPLQPSLTNILKELVKDGYTTKSKDITKWIPRGVLLINPSLTVAEGKPNSHSKWWLEKFAPYIMKFLDKHIQPQTGGVIIEWGNNAKSFDKYFGKRHRRIQSPHPSPLSAHKGFFGSKPFSRANKHLKSLGVPEVNWNL